MVAHLLVIPALGVETENLHRLMASLAYTENSRPIRHPVSKKSKKIKKDRQYLMKNN